jgi:PIN domain nuclease of toxin-antitoxin system
VNSGEAFVLDASALLAFFLREKGWEEVEGVISRDDSVVYMSAVNYAEAMAKAVAYGRTPARILETIQTLGIRIMDFDLSLAGQTGILKPQAAAWGLSLADCACLVLARQLDATALTADTAWANLKDSFRMAFIR